MDVGDKIDELAQTLLVQGEAGVILGQHPLEGGVVALHSDHGLVHELADRGLAGVLLELRPAGLGWHPEDSLRSVFVRVLGVGTQVALGLEASAVGLKSVGDVLEEDKPQHDMLILGGVHGAAQGVSGRPELGLEAQCSTVLFTPLHDSSLFLRVLPHSSTPAIFGVSEATLRTRLRVSR